MPEPVLRCLGLRKAYRSPAGELPVLRGVDLELASGEAVAVTGESGAGKSTLLQVLGGLDRADAGELWWGGQRVDRLPGRELARRRAGSVGFVFQSYQLIPTLTAEENVLLPAELAGNAAGAAARARMLLDEVGLAERRDHYPVQLSGGEQQRVALARAFMLRPPILMADEPTGNLDTANGAHVLELLLNMNLKENTTLVLVTHDPQLAARAARRIHMRDGVIVSDES